MKKNKHMRENKEPSKILQCKRIYIKKEIILKVEIKIEVVLTHLNKIHFLQHRIPYSKEKIFTQKD